MEILNSEIQKKSIFFYALLLLLFSSFLGFMAASKLYENGSSTTSRLIPMIILYSLMFNHSYRSSSKKLKELFSYKKYFIFLSVFLFLPLVLLHFLDFSFILYIISSFLFLIFLYVIFLYLKQRSKFKTQIQISDEGITHLRSNKKLHLNWSEVEDLISLNQCGKKNFSVILIPKDDDSLKSKLTKLELLQCFSYKRLFYEIPLSNYDVSNAEAYISIKSAFERNR